MARKKTKYEESSRKTHNLGPTRKVLVSRCSYMRKVGGLRTYLTSIIVLRSGEVFLVDGRPSTAIELLLSCVQVKRFEIKFAQAVSLANIGKIYDRELRKSGGIVELEIYRGNSPRR